MRMRVDPRSSEFSDLRCLNLRSQMSDVRVPGPSDECGRTGGFGSTWRSPTSTWDRRSRTRALAGGMASLLYLVLNMVHLAMPPWDTTPWVHPSTCTAPHGHGLVRGHRRTVLWALNGPCVTLKIDLKSICRGLSGFWPPFQPHVARIGLDQRPQTTYVYPFHLRFYQEWSPYPNENVAPS